MKLILVSTLLTVSSLCADAQNTNASANPAPSFDSSSRAEAQRNNTFADLGLSFGSGMPGVSATYNRKLTKRFGIGLGAQGYFYPGIDRFRKPIERFIPAPYADLRWYRGVGKGQMFTFIDVGVNLYLGFDAYVSSVVEHSNGLYSGLGIGYYRPVNKAGLSPYLSLKLVSDTYKSTQTYMGHESSSVSLDATIVLSAGLRF
ncbi:MAG: hypothetical protein JWQ38_2720 [Flavipsychrobacter sp.]|nr:hypothetical protein [Flavipsychrobacter sp.]